MSTELIRKWLDADAYHRDQQRKMDEAQASRDEAYRVRSNIEDQVSKLVGPNITHRLFEADGVHVLVEWVAGTPNRSGYAAFRILKPETT